MAYAPQRCSAAPTKPIMTKAGLTHYARQTGVRDRVTCAVCCLEVVRRLKSHVAAPLDLRAPQPSRRALAALNSSSLSAPAA